MFKTMAVKSLTRTFSFVVAGVLAVFAASTSTAMDLTWKGKYRFEGLTLQNPDLNDSKRDKSYILHHLILEPKIAAADGVNIYSRFDIMNSDTYPASQVGQVFGGGTTAATAGCTQGSPAAECSKASRNSMSDETLRVTQLYLHWINEQSSLTIGRAPLQFGLGMSYNAGQGDFDHWLETRDLVAYKIVMGNISFTPMYSKLYEGQLIGEDDISQYLLHLQYDNPDTDLTMGLMYDIRVAPKWSNDAPFGSSAYGGANSSRSLDTAYNTRLLSVFVKRKFESVSIGVESAFHSGATGIRTGPNNATGADVGVDSYGLALELDYKPIDSRWNWALRGGLASGDNIDTANRYEGFFFNRNYDIAFLLFNHHLGGWNAAGTRGFTGERNLTNYDAKEHLNSVDSETVSNVMYAAPSFRHILNDKWSWTGKLVYATLQEAQRSSGSKDLGLEVDLGLTFKPHERITWVTEIGALFPGTGFGSGTAGVAPLKNAYGAQLRAAFSF